MTAGGRRRPEGAEISGSAPPDRPIAFVAATERGRAHARHLATALPGASVVPGPPREALARAFAEARGIVCFMATGAAVRLVAPLLTDKRTDPGVVCVDDAARFAVALTGGHEGGANALAERVAAALGATPVITTASEAAGVPALDGLGADLGFHVAPESDLAAVGAAVVGGEPVALVADRQWPLPPLPPNVTAPTAAGPTEDGSRPVGGAAGSVRAAGSVVGRSAGGGLAGPADDALPVGGGAAVPAIVVSDRLGDWPRPAVIYRPPSLIVGVGCSRGASAEEILDLVDRTLAEAGLAPESVAALASADVKADEPGLLAAAEARGWPLRLHPAEALAAVAVPNPSEVVRDAVGTASVAEAAALLTAAEPAALHELTHPPELVVEKRRSPMATATVARRPVRGRLALVSLGPGDDRLLPPLAREALARASAVIGYRRYLDQVRHLLRPGTDAVAYELGEEVERCRDAIARAAAGAAVALVSSGDVGVYAMASPALEAGGLAHVDVTIIPGVTAAHAAAALVGSPLGHDHCAISLSDLLTPWEAIRARIRAAAEGDFAIALYNPRSRRRTEQLGEARAILLEHRAPGTPMAIVTDAYRAGQRVELATLADFDATTIGMTTVVIVGSSATRVVEGRMVTPRGYAEVAA